MAQEIEIVLEHDTKKELKAGKRRYGDDDGHNLYLTGDEVTKLGEPDRIRLTVEEA